MRFVRVRGRAFLRACSFEWVSEGMRVRTSLRVFVLRILELIQRDCNQVPLWVWRIWPSGQVEWAGSSVSRVLLRVPRRNSALQ